jgi:hypothetical protein
MPWNSSKARLTALLLFAVIVASVAGCGRTVSPSELPGTWTISRNSQHLFPADFDVTSATFVFKSDGTFTASGLPQEVVLIDATGSDAVARINGSGRWVLLERLGFSDATGFMLEFKAIQGPGKYKLPFSTMLFSVSETEGIVKISYFRDDPDLGRRIEFEKQK